MAGAGKGKVSAASARAHTRKDKQSRSSGFPSGILKRILVVFFVGILAWAYKAIQPSPTKTCGSPEGPPITASRIKLRDGRHLAYKEHGVARDVARFKIIFLHGFGSCRHDAVIANGLSPELVEEMGIYIVSFDRPGYGESDPHPQRTLKSLVMDVEELADQLELGSKFYITGYSMGGEMTWSCLKYIPHRLAGVTLLTPVVNYWWRSFPTNLSTKAFYQQLPQDQWTLRISHYAPWLTHWWSTQKWFPSSSVISRNPAIYSSADTEIMVKHQGRISHREHARQQGLYESIFRDMNIAFGTWEFDPMELENPFPNGEGSVHIWQGDEDGLVPVLLQRYIAQRLPWIRYHELPGMGHLFPLVEGMPDTIVKAMLTGA